MSADIEPYEQPEQFRRDLRNPHTDSWTDVLEQVADLALKISKTDFVPDGFRGNVAATAAAILYGREVGFPPMTALSTLHSIKGRVAMSAEAMRAKALAAGHDIVIVTSTSARCEVKGRRRNSDEWTTVTWTLDDTRQAKLGGDNWAKYPRQMLQARATAELCRLVFADVLHGIASVEELEAEGERTLASVGTARVQRRKALDTTTTPLPPLPPALQPDAPAAHPDPPQPPTDPPTPDPAPAPDADEQTSQDPPDDTDGAMFPTPKPV